jgi:serine/threonine-protein kinase
MVYDPMEDLRAALSDRYRIEGEAGRGGMATVLKAEDLKHKRTVAIKVLSADLSHTLGAERFQREIHIAARLQHPHILPVFDSGEAGGLLYYVMPFVTGESLRARLTRDSQLPLDDAIGFTAEVAGALAYAHAQGVVHRDIKPENILIEHGHAVVADFGIAHAVSDSAEKLTATGMSVGTAQYMSPEQFGGQTVDARSDIYSLGCVLYEMLVGQVPFTGPSMMALMARHTMERVPSIRVVRPTVPDELEEVVYVALEKAAADRFQTMEQFRQALLGAGAATTPLVRTRAHTARHRTAAALSVPWYRRPAIQIAAGLLLVGVTGGAIAANVTRSDAVALDANKIAVLYFEDRSGSDSLRYLADGLTQSLVDQLRGTAGLDVVSTSGVAPYRDRVIATDSIAPIAAHLGVGSIVRGSVRPTADGHGLQVRVALLDASGDEFAARTFDHGAAALLALPDTVANQVAEFLRRRLGERIDLAERHSRAGNSDAWALTQRAERRRRDVERLFAADSASAAFAALADADSMLSRAQRLDARWSEPSALRARLALLRARYRRGDAARMRAAVDSGLVFANRALALDPRDSDALEARGTLRFFAFTVRLVEGDSARALLQAAEDDLLAAVRWRTTQATAWATLSSLYYRKPDVTQARYAAQRAYESDAYLSAADLILTRLFWTNYDQELFAEASRWCLEGRRRFPSAPFFYECQLWLQTAPKGVSIDPDRAWALRDSLVKYAPARTKALDAKRAEILVAGSLARATLADSARRVLDRARLDARAVDPERSLAGNEAVIRVILGDRAEAVRLIKEYLTVNPDHRGGFSTGTVWWWRDLQNDPEFRRLVQAS